VSTPAPAAVRTPPASTRVMAIGVTGSGKTYTLREYFLPKFPRALIVDPLGQFTAQPNAIVVYDVDDVRDALAEAVSRGRTWRVVALVDSESAVELGPLLMPPEWPRRKAFAEAVRGMVLVCDEIADVIPNAGSERGVRHWWSRGRHVGLSILASSQRPSDVHRIVTSMSQVVLCFATHEPNDMDYMRRLSPEVVRLHASIPHLGAVAYETATRRAYLIDQRWQVVRETSPAGIPDGGEVPREQAPVADPNEPAAPRGEPA
jgi:hypothetical protein